MEYDKEDIIAIRSLLKKRINKYELYAFKVKMSGIREYTLKQLKYQILLDKTNLILESRSFK